MTAQNDGINIDAVKVAVWIGILTALLKALQVLWKAIAKRLLMPVLYQVAKEAMAEDIRDLKESAETTRKLAIELTLTVQEVRGVIRDMRDVAVALDDLRSAQDQDHAVLTVVAGFLNVDVPERRARVRRAEDR